MRSVEQGRWMFPCSISEKVSILFRKRMRDFYEEI